MCVMVTKQLTQHDFGICFWKQVYEHISYQTASGKWEQTLEQDTVDLKQTIKVKKEKKI